MSNQYISRNKTIKKTKTKIKFKNDSTKPKTNVNSNNLKSISNKRIPTDKTKLIWIIIFLGTKINLFIISTYDRNQICNFFWSILVVAII